MNEIHQTEEPLDTRQLRTFRAVAECGSFTAAARRLFLTQSAISHSIRSLEAMLGCKLLRREGGRVTLTEGGEVLLHHVRQLFACMQQARDDLRTLNSPGHGRLRIGTLVTACQLLLPPVLLEFRECFPDVRLAVQTGDTGSMLRALVEREFDLVLALQRDDFPQLPFTPLFGDRLGLALSPQHPLAACQEVTVDQLMGEQLLVFNKTSLTHHLIERYFAGVGFKPASVVEVGSMQAIQEMAKIGCGIGIMAPWMALDDIAAGTLAFRFLAGTDNGSLDRCWGIYHGSGSRPGLPEQLFTGVCREVAKSIRLRQQTVLAQAEVVPAA